MSVENEITRAVRRIAAFDTENRKEDSELEEIISKVKTSYTENNVNFSQLETLILRQNNKRRIVKQYVEQYSAENILCLCCKHILDWAFKIKYPNRNQIIKDLFNILPAAIQMSDFTIVKVDFKDYFNSISSTYAFEKYLKHEIMDRRDRDLVCTFVDETEYAYAGLSTSNAIAEIIAEKFDMALRKEFIGIGLIYFERYIDDCIVILNKYIAEDEIKKKLQKILEEIFHDATISCKNRCRTKFNTNKFKYITRRSISNTTEVFDFLGYEFCLTKNNRKINIKYGITSDKRTKYNDRIDRLISFYTDPKSKDYHKIELLRHRILAFTSREVYLTKRFNSSVWKVKGFIANYSELRYFLGTDLIEKDTENFLKNMVEDAFNRATLPSPYFLKSGPKLSNRYNLFGNMKSNNTILLVDRIGYDYKALVKLCKSIEIPTIDANGTHRGYGTLVRDYLIKVKVGY